MTFVRISRTHEHDEFGTDFSRIVKKARFLFEVGIFALLVSYLYG